MPAADPAGGQKYWHFDGHTFDTLERSGKDPGDQKWWGVQVLGEPSVFTLGGLVGTATPPGPGGGSTFPALTVAP